MRPLGAWLLAMAFVVDACSSVSRPSQSTSPPSAAPLAVYAALGASETAGVGLEDPARESFPQRLFQRLGRGSLLFNFGLPGETTQAALSDELPAALAVHPTLATVWFNVDDLAAGVPVADFKARLDGLVGGLRRGGVTQVLVANTPRLDRLPAYAACRPDPPPGVHCPLGPITLPPPEQVDAQVQAYNATIAEVVTQEGATLVNLYAAGEVPELHPEYVGPDGFHPSAAGAAAIAATFASAAHLP